MKIRVNVNSNDKVWRASNGQASTAYSKIGIHEAKQNHRFGCTTARFTENGVKRPKESGLGIINATPNGASTSFVRLCRYDYRIVLKLISVLNQCVLGLQDASQPGSD